MSLIYDSLLVARKELRQGITALSYLLYDRALGAKTVTLIWKWPPQANMPDKVNIIYYTRMLHSVVILYVKQFYLNLSPVILIIYNLF